MVRGVIVTTQVGLSARVVVVSVSSGMVTTRGRPALSKAIFFCRVWEFAACNATNRVTVQHLNAKCFAALLTL
jgi:hypothetical protein